MGHPLTQLAATPLPGVKMHRGSLFAHAPQPLEESPHQRSESYWFLGVSRRKAAICGISGKRPPNPQTTAYNALISPAGKMCPLLVFCWVFVGILVGFLLGKCWVFLGFGWFPVGFRFLAISTNPNIMSTFCCDSGSLL